MAKRALDVGRIMRLVNHGPTVLVSSHHEGVCNIITLAWTTPVSADPPMLAIAVAPARFSHQLIARSMEFVVNVPGSRLLGAVWYCGTKSGRDGDKFEGARLTRETGAKVAAPLVAECFAHVECRVVDAPTTGDHTLFIGEAVAARVESEAFDGHLRLAGRYHTLHYLGGREFLTSAGTRLTAG
jgi:flavin reductase (DIM6/NTAB) family NADH-FMN oxidoreductase RutF